MKNHLQKYEAEAKKLMEQMTLEEKAALCSGSDFWHTKDVERLGVKKVMVTDGPHGLRKQAGESDHLGINQSVPATCFPTAATVACSFDTELIQRMGEALGEECLQEDVAVLLGPGANIKRSPLCGRNFEYFSEDPFLTGEMAAALIKGVQSKGIGTSLKHFAANNQEARRMVIDEIIDERALREIYLSGFEKAVKKAQPWTVMCAYNQINGAYGSQNKKLLTDILRDEWGFGGAVMTDWGATVDRVQGIEAGLDLEMPYSGGGTDREISEAVLNGRLSEETLDTAVTRLLCLLLCGADTKRGTYRYDQAAHHELAREVAEKSAVLLKNEDTLLPLKKGTKIAVLGEFAKKPRYQGAGSSHINPNRLVSLCDALGERKIDYTYECGYDAEDDTPNEDLLKKAEDAAGEAEVIIVCIGLPDAYESEGFDRTHLNLPESHIALLHRAAKENSNVVVLLFGGSALAMPWLADAKAMLMLYLGGEAGGEAAADLLFGDACPCGKLAETFPHNLNDNPSAAYFPGESKTVEYRESIFVGYRYYDTAGVEVLFPFGYGLSYTTFAYSNLHVEQTAEGSRVTVKIKNTGNTSGAEIVQIYVSQKNAKILRPNHELKGFAKAELAAGEEKTVMVHLDADCFDCYNAQKQRWETTEGIYTVTAAAHVCDLRCSVDVEVEGVTCEEIKIPASYRKLGAPLSIKTEDFEMLCGHQMPPANKEPDEPYTLHSTMAEIADTQAGKTLLAQMQQMNSPMNGGDEDESGLTNMIQRMMKEMPVRSLVMFSQGALSKEQLQQIVDAMNKEQNRS